MQFNAEESPDEEPNEEGGIISKLKALLGR